MQIFITIIILILSCGSAWAACGGSSPSLTAADCSQAEVAACITTATDGDTITIPEGECTWEADVTVPDNEQLTIQGSGTLGTVITANMSGYVIDTGYSGSRLTNLYVKMHANATNVGVRVRGTGWKVDRNKFEGNTGYKLYVSPAGGATNTTLTGVIFLNTFVNARVYVRGSLSSLLDDDTQHTIWATAYTLGSESEVYVEGNTFTTPRTAPNNCIDADMAAHYVYRFNTSDGCYIEAHSNQTTARGTRNWEIYNNSISDSYNKEFTPFYLRAGTGVVFNNSIGDSFDSNVIYMDNVRSGDGGACDGSATGWDGNTGEGDAVGYPCRDQIGRGIDSTEWDESPLVEVFAQSSAPAYFWNNKKGAANVEGGVSATFKNPYHIVVNQDFYNSQHPTYVAATCPHPLTGLTGSCDSATAGKGGYNVELGTVRGVTASGVTIQ